MPIQLFVLLDWTYKVKVIPIDTTKVYTIGTTGQFNCSITPNPVSLDQNVILRYYWYLGSSIFSYSSSSSNTSIYFHQGYSKLNKISCEVRANNIELSRGYFLIEVEGNRVLCSIQICI